jgi:glyoxylase-like metal-dependent hydrolase (beta-lactamase superfamily II)
MPQIELVLAGGNVNTDQCKLGLCTVVLIRGEKNILVDVAHFGRRQLILQELEKKGLKPGDIETVVLTHCHWDHAQNVDLFPNAEFVIHPKEVEYSRKPNTGEWATAHYFARMLEGLKVTDAREGLSLMPGVVVMETPGHSPGHISLVVDTPQGKAVIAGDAFSDADAPRRGLPFLVFWDEAQARESVKRIASAASVFYPGHDRPFRVKPDGNVEYLTPPLTVQLSAIFESHGSTFGLTLGLDTPRTSEIHPAAKRAPRG